MIVLVATTVRKGNTCISSILDIFSKIASFWVLLGPSSFLKIIVELSKSLYNILASMKQENNKDLGHFSPSY